MALYRPITFSQHLLQKQIHPQAKIIDATIGNGNDTAFIANLLGPKGKLFGFDIQQTAIDQNKTRLEELKPACEITLFKQSHASMIDVLADVTGQIDAIIFNLGYLPHADETITTTLPSTYTAILQSLCLLKPKGLLIIVAYKGHAAGQTEFQALGKLFAHAHPSHYYVTHYGQINALGDPPSVFTIEKLK